MKAGNMASVKEDLEILKKVQKLDKEIYDLGLLVAETPEKVNLLKEQFEQKKDRYNQLEEKIKQLKLGVKEKELELGKKDSEITKLDGQLSQVKTNKEYSAMLEQIASIKADKGIFEEKILADWDEIEQLNQEREGEKKILSEEEGKLKQEIKKFEDEGRQSEEKIKSLKEERKKILEPVTLEVKELYEKVLAKREGVALAKIEGENCGGCQFLLRPQIINEVQLQETITLCERCTRILYFEPQ